MPADDGTLISGSTLGPGQAGSSCGTRPSRTAELGMHRRRRSSSTAACWSQGEPNRQPGTLLKMAAELLRGAGHPAGPGYGSSADHRHQRCGQPGPVTGSTAPSTGRQPMPASSTTCRCSTAAGTAARTACSPSPEVRRPAWQQRLRAGHAGRRLGRRYQPAHVSNCVFSGDAASAVSVPADDGTLISGTTLGPGQAGLELRDTTITHSGTWHAQAAPFIMDGGVLPRG